MEISEHSININNVPEHCIYRVPNRIRGVKPEAYTPQVVLIGPLHRSFKALDAGAETSSNPWDLKKDYLKMEELKKTYLESYTKRVGEDTIEEMTKTIQANEKNIRASYEESTEWIPSEYFVDLILQDSVFIMEFMIRTRNHEKYSDDMMLDQPLHASMVENDLILLENQLPYFIFDSLFSSNMIELGVRVSLETLIMTFFSLRAEEETNFKHFTDMFRYVYEESLDLIPIDNGYRWSPITELRNADYLSQAGVNFMSSDAWDFQKKTKRKKEKKNEVRVIRLTTRVSSRSVVKQKQLRQRINGLSLHVEFGKGVLMLPVFHANEWWETILRNVIAFEQCYVAVTPFTSNYIHFLNFLITSDKDVELLTEEGVITNTLGRPSLVVDMVNKLQLGGNVGAGSQYYYVAKNLRAHCKSRRKRCWATLRKVYFSDLLTGTATLAAVFLLLLTLIGTVATVIQTYKSF